MRLTLLFTKLFKNVTAHCGSICELRDAVKSSIALWSITGTLGCYKCVV